MSQKAISKEQLLSVAAASPLASAIALAMALPSNAEALDFKVSTQQELNNAITAIEDEMYYEAEGSETHTITFSAAAAGKTLTLPHSYLDSANNDRVVINGSAAPGLELNLSYSESVGVEVDDAHLTIQNVQLNIGAPASETYADAEGEGGFGTFRGIDVEEGSLTLDRVNVVVNAERFNVIAFDTDESTVTIQNSHFVGDTGSTTHYYYGYGYEAEGPGPVLLGKQLYSYTEAHNAVALKVRYPYAQGEGEIGVKITKSSFQDFQQNGNYLGYSMSKGTVDIAEGYAEVVIAGSEFKNNSGTGALRFYRQNGVVISGSEFSNNEVNSPLRGLVTTRNTNLSVITNSSIYNNSLTQNKYAEAGVVYGESGGFLGVFNTTISDNSGGAAVYSKINNNLVMNSTITKNNTTATWEKYSPSYYLATRPSVELETETYSEAEGAITSYESFDIVNSIVSGNNGANLGNEVYEEGGIIASIIGSNLYDAEGSVTETDANPMLSPSTSQTGKVYVLREGSPAIDSANADWLENVASDVEAEGEIAQGINPASFDQTGNERIVGDAPDMGAVEWRKGAAGAAPKNPSASSSKLFGSLGTGFLASVLGLSWLRRRKQ